ncbi:hypothetical protein MKX01_008947 [Papaver californicum]|nr:hypothetical protein MKX01_008947 [Papaver californicum]
MEIVSPVLYIFSRLWTCSARNTDYVRKLKLNLNTLEISFHSLRCKRDDVNTRIEMAESNPIEPAKRTNVVSDWLQRVQALETEVQKIFDDNQAIKNDGGCYICCWGQKSCPSAYRLGKLVVEKMNAVQDLLKGDFQDVTYRCQPDPLQPIPTVEVIGMDSKFNEVLDSLVTEGNDVRTVGLYGMGGVGKTTLLQKVNNEFAESKHFDLVIFVVVSKDLNIKSIQNQIGEKLGISWREETEIYKRGSDILKVLQNKKSLLLLDDIWEGIDLETIGVSKNTIQITGSKIVFTTKEYDCLGDKRLKIHCLGENQAWSLFQQKVKQQALSCHPDVPEVARKIAKECRGLPLAIIAIGRTMSSKTDLQQWQYALHTLHESASQFSVLAIMKYSYDNLQSQKLKSCFLYWSLYPEDCSIYRHELVALWLGEGFLDNDDDIMKAKNEGHDVIRCLKDAVKMEYLVKMHDIVRDLAIWVASDLGRKKNIYLTLQAESKLKLHEWEKAERISLIDNKAIKILNGAPRCSNLLTLLLNYSSVSVISDDFFRFMPMLRVLHMSFVKLKKLPTSIFSLSELHYLGLPKYDEDTVLTPGSLTSVTKMKDLVLSESCCHWEVEGGPSLHELESLQHLIYLQITIRTGLALQRLVTSPKLQLCTRNLLLKYCPSITSLTLLPSSPSSPVSLFSLVHMIAFRLRNCDDLEDLIIMSRDNKVTLFTTLELLSILWDVPQQSRFYSVNLKRVTIQGPLFLIELDGLEEIISDGFAAEKKLTNTFSRLNYLRINSLRNLERTYQHDYNVKFFLLENVFVSSCPQLKKLPFNTNSVIPRTLKMIKGEKEWWESLEWEDEVTKSNLAPYFHDNGYILFCNMY